MVRLQAAGANIILLVRRTLTHNPGLAQAQLRTNRSRYTILGWLDTIAAFGRYYGYTLRVTHLNPRVASVWVTTVTSSAYVARPGVVLVLKGRYYNADGNRRSLNSTRKSSLWYIPALKAGLYVYVPAAGNRIPAILVRAAGQVPVC